MLVIYCENQGENLRPNGTQIFQINFTFQNMWIQVIPSNCLRCEAGLVIQATGRTEFEDGLRPGSPGGVLSNNPSVSTSSLVTSVV